MKRLRLDVIAVLAASLLSPFAGCGGTTRPGSESNFVCSHDSECPGGTCVEGSCTTDAGTGGTSATASGGEGGTAVSVDAGSGGALGGTGTAGTPGSGGEGSGGAPAVTGGCAATWPFGAAGMGSGGALPNPPTCPVDADGIADVDQAIVCDHARCPASSSELLTGLDCTEVASPFQAGPITVSKGCGYDQVVITNDELTYIAVFDAATDALMGVEIRTSYQSPPCDAFGYRFGMVSPFCDTGPILSCKRPTESTGPYAGCRSPKGPGCGVCCSPPVGTPTGCNVWTSLNDGSLYDATGFAEECPCNCPDCATCDGVTEDRLRTLAEHPECNCPPPPPGAGGAPGAAGAPGAGGGGPHDPCIDHCGARNQLMQQCPGVRE